MRRGVFLLAIPAVLLLVAGGMAAVDVEVDLTTQCTCSLERADTIECFTFEATRGTVLSLSAKSKTVRLSAELRGPGDVLVWDAGPSTGLSAKGLSLPSSGTYELRFSGDAAGDFVFKMKGAAQKAFGEPSLFVGAGSTETYYFAAPAGSALSLALKPAKGSGAVPRFGELWNGTDISEQGSYSEKGHKVTVPVTGEGGNLSVEVKNLGATGGGIALTVKVKAPKPPKSKLDLRGVAFDRPGEPVTVVSRTVAAADGGGVAVDDSTSDLHGAGVTVPPGALASDTRIVVGTSPPLPRPPTETPSGPPVEFGPPGTSFSSPVEVTVPYDPEMLPGGADPLTDLSVVHVSPGGGEEVLDPVPGGVDTVGHTVTVEVTSFSRLMAIAPVGPPNLQGREYWFLFHEFEMDADYGDDDSRERYVGLYRGDLAFGAPGTCAVDAWIREISHGHTDNRAAYSQGSTTSAILEGWVDVASDHQEFNADWGYHADGRRVWVDYGDGPDAYDASVDGRFLLGCRALESGFRASVDLAMEKPAANPTPAQLAGSWWLFYLEFERERRSEQQLYVSQFRAFGTMTIKSDGTFTASGDDYGSMYEVDGGWQTEKGAGGTFGTFTVQADGSIQAIWDSDGDPETTVLYPARGLGVMAGIKPGADDRAEPLLFMIRKSTSTPGTGQTGDFLLCGAMLDTEVYPVQFQGPAGDTALLAPDLHTSAMTAHATVNAGTGILTLRDFTDRWVERDPQVAGGLLLHVDTDPGPQNLPLTLTKDGRVAIDVGEGNVVGALDPTGTLGIVVDDPRGSSDSWGVNLLLRRVPGAD